MSTVTRRYESQLDSLTETAERIADDGPEWLQEARRLARRVHAEHGVPSTRAEEWKYTSLRRFAETRWSLAARHVATSSLAVPGYVEGAVRIVMVNGRFDHGLSSTDGVEHGVTVRPLQDAIAAGDELVRWHMGQAGPEATQTVDREIRPDVYPLAALNTALFEDGVFIHVAAGSGGDALVEIVHVLADPSETAMALPRTLIIVEKGGRAKFVETYVTEADSPGAVLPVTEVFLGEGAVVEHVRVQDQGPSSTHIALWQTRQHARSEYRSYNVCYGSQLARVDQGIWLGGEGTETRLDGVVCANGEQHIDSHTRLDHAMPNANSFEIYKQIVDDSATVVFNGKIFVHQDAQKTDAKQTNQALLLSPKATIDSKPQLEIFADDVKCTHGATVGQLEDTPMFYMRQRGVPRDAAEAVLVYAFAAEVLELITVDAVRVALETKLYEKLGVDLK